MVHNGHRHQKAWVRLMAFQLNCPCGTMITAPDDELIAAVRAHLAEQHPGRTYSDTEIMLFAMPIPDRAVPGRTA